MESIGKLAQTAVAQAGEGLRPSPSKALARPVSSTKNPPKLLDQVVDYGLPRLFNGYRPDDTPWELVRALTDSERAMVERRADELRSGITGWLPGERDAVNAALGAMFAGFRSMRHQGDDARNTVLVTASVLSGYPLWAITKACRKIAMREIKREWSGPPDDGELLSVVESVVSEYRKLLRSAERLLTAAVKAPRELAPPRPDRAEIEAKLGRPIRAAEARPVRESDAIKPPDGRHAERVAADLAARKARNGSAA